jgi:hypothetical protein
MAKYDPNLKYQWNNEDRIEISGRDFGLFLNTFRSILNTEEAARIMLTMKAADAIESIMAEYVEKNVIKEISEDKPLKIVK